jgi:organic hydroperoxide reductase OsmC/OhrA
MSTTTLSHADPTPRAPHAGEEDFAVTLALRDGYRFGVDFGLPGVADLMTDEPPPLGSGEGPNPARLLAAAVGNCLAASALFCLRKAKIKVSGMDVRVDGTVVRNERGRLRIGALRVTLEPRVRTEDRDRMGRCLELFQDFCMVTESVRGGLDVTVDVAPAEATLVA